MSFLDQYNGGVRDVARRQSELRHRVLDQRDKPADPLRLAEVRDRYDEAYQSLGARGAAGPLPGESVFSYRRRLASGLQQFSPAWRDANLHDLGPDALNAIEPQIIVDARAAVADHSRGNADGSLRESRRTDSGHGVTEFAGHPLSWMCRFMSQGRTVRQFQRQDGTPIRIQRRSI